MASQPLISIIIPIYNIEDYIKECISSIIYQSYTHLEIILINDGSTDNSWEIISKAAKEDSRIKIINRTKNRGLGTARNSGLRKSSGKYILFIDGDDYLEKDTVYQLVTDLPKNSDVCLFNGISFDHTTKQLINTSYFWITDQWCGKKGLVYSKYRNKLLFFPSACLKIYSADFLKSNKINFPNIYGEDVEFWLKCLLKTKNIYYKNYFGYYRRIRENSIMTGDQKKNISDRIGNLDRLLALSKNHPDFYNYFVTIYIPGLQNRIADIKNEDLLDYFIDTYNKLSKKYD